MTKEIKKYIDITPHRSILTKISQTGYSIQEALSELIDNAIDARQEGKKLLVLINISPQEIRVEDNAQGMNEDTVSKAIRLGFSNKKEQLGEFGLGLKTATSFLGKSFELKTKQRNSDKEYILRYDEGDWLKNGNWHKYPLIIKKQQDKEKSGTIITIKNLKLKFSETVLKNILLEFGTRFGPFIKNNELELIFNNEKCQAPQINIIKNKKQAIDFSFGKIKAKGWWGYQLSGFNKSYYGFDTFRRGRLVTTYDKIGLNPNQDIRQIVGEIHIDGIPITHDKKNWLKSSPEYQELEQRKREYFKNFERKPKKLLSGYPASGGKVIGKIKKINMFMSNKNSQEEMDKIDANTIIVTEMTRPYFLLGIRRSAGVITDMGGALCHAAIVAREFNIPTVVGTQIATSLLQDDQEVIIDADNGIIYEI